MKLWKKKFLHSDEVCVWKKQEVMQTLPVSPMESFETRHRILHRKFQTLTFSSPLTVLQYYYFPHPVYISLTFAGVKRGSFRRQGDNRSLNEIWISADWRFVWKICVSSSLADKLTDLQVLNRKPHFALWSYSMSNCDENVKEESHKCLVDPYNIRDKLRGMTTQKTSVVGWRKQKIVFHFQG